MENFSIYFVQLELGGECLTVVSLLHKYGRKVSILLQNTDDSLFVITRNEEVSQFIQMLLYFRSHWIHT